MVKISLSTYRRVGRHWTAGWHWMVIPFPYSLNSAYNSHVTRYVCVLDCTLKVSVPQPQNFWNSPQPWTLFFCLNDNFQMKNLIFRDKTLIKSCFFQRVQGYTETSAWFVHVTDCYCSGKKNSNKFFLTTKLPFVQSRPILMR